MEAKHIIFLVILIFIVVIIATVVRVILKFLRKTRAIVSEVSEIAKAVNTVGDMLTDSETKNLNTAPQQKTVGGATDMFLKTIQKDFPSFHNPDAEADIKSVIKDYLMIIHGQKNEFEANSVNKNTMKNFIKKERGSVSDVKFHRIAIYNYKKDLDYATAIYRCSVGYRLDNRQIETRYEVKYTFQIKDDGIATKEIICKNCLAPIDNVYNEGAIAKAKANGVCPYCGTKIIRDTIMEWKVSDLKEMP